MPAVGMPFVLTSNGRAACAIVSDATGRRRPRAAAMQLAEGFRALSGINLPVLKSDAAIRTPAICLGILGRSRLIRDLLAGDQVLLSGAGERNTRATVLSNLTLYPEDLGGQGFVVYGARCQGQPTLILTANTEQGLAYAVQTLLSRIYLEDGAWRIFGLGTRFLPALNRPAFAVRSLATFISGPCYMFPGQWEKEFGRDYRRFLDWMSGHKFNHLLDWSFTPDAGIGYRSKRFPELVNHLHPNVRHEYMPGMLRYARQRHIKTWLFFKLPFLDYTGDKSGPHCPLIGEDRPIVSAVRTAAAAGRRGQSLRMVCLSRPQTRNFWRQYIAELVTRYPEIDGLGCEVGEHLSSYCACPACKGREQERGYEYFKLMADTARRIKPSLKLWFYRAAGAARIEERRSEFGDITMIGWGFTGNLGPRGVPCRAATGFSAIPATMSMPRRICASRRAPSAGTGLTAFKSAGRNMAMEWEAKYRAFEELTWNPDLSLSDLAVLNTIRAERRYDRELADIYLQWMRRKPRPGPFNI